MITNVTKVGGFDKIGTVPLGVISKIVHIFLLCFK